MLTSGVAFPPASCSSARTASGKAAGAAKLDGSVHDVWRTREPSWVTRKTMTAAAATHPSETRGRGCAMGRGSGPALVNSCKTADARRRRRRSEEHTSELQSRLHLVCRLLLEKK